MNWPRNEGIRYNLDSVLQRENVQCSKSRLQECENVQQTTN